MINSEMKISSKRSTRDLPSSSKPYPHGCCGRGLAAAPGVRRLDCGRRAPTRPLRRPRVCGLGCWRKHGHRPRNSVLCQREDASVPLNPSSSACASQVMAAPRNRLWMGDLQPVCVPVVRCCILEPQRKLDLLYARCLVHTLRSRNPFTDGILARAACGQAEESS